MTTETRTTRWLDELMVTTRPDGRLRVVIAEDATEDEEARGRDVQRAMTLGPGVASVDAVLPELPEEVHRLMDAGQRDAARALTIKTLPPPLRAQVQSGALTFEQGLRLAVQRATATTDRIRLSLSLAGQIRALWMDHNREQTVGEVLARAWWDGRFDEPDDPLIGESAAGDPDRLEVILDAWLEVAERIGGRRERVQVAIDRLMLMRPADAIVRAALIVRGVHKGFYDLDGDR